MTFGIVDKWSHGIRWYKHDRYNKSFWRKWRSLRIILSSQVWWSFLSAKWINFWVINFEFWISNLKTIKSKCSIAQHDENNRINYDPLLKHYLNQARIWIFHPISFNNGLENVEEVSSQKMTKITANIFRIVFFKWTVILFTKNYKTTILLRMVEILTLLNIFQRDAPSRSRKSSVNDVISYVSLLRI